MTIYNEILTLTNWPNQTEVTPVHICKAVENLKAFEIQVLSTKICDTICSNLGPIAKSYIASKVNKQSRNILITYKLLARDAIENKKEVFSNEEVASFLHICNKKVTEALSKVFSTPILFVEQGVSWALSEHEQLGILAETLAEMNKALTLVDIPTRYTVTLHVNLEETQKNKELTFQLIQKSEGCIFHEESFTIKSTLEHYQKIVQEMK
ncbi:hypothetical protein BN1013_00215 [Candidatus Rubidus massiliensis]|nr:hypothetical protein BN1013_00215 [Candidatus Rubidus massiliensis]